MNFVLRCSLLSEKCKFHKKFSVKRKLNKNSPICAKACNVEQNSRKETPLKIQFYFQTNLTQPITTFLKCWKWHWFNIGLNITLFCFVSSNLLPNFVIALTHSIFNLKSSVIPLDKMSHCVEKDAQVKILI